MRTEAQLLRTHLFPIHPGANPELDRRDEVLDGVEVPNVKTSGEEVDL